MGAAYSPNLIGKFLPFYSMVLSGNYGRIIEVVYLYLVYRYKNLLGGEWTRWKSRLYHERSSSKKRI
jgi:hypothetical protein